MKLQRVAAVAVCVLLAGCPGFGDKVRGDLCETGEVTFEQDVNPILERSCSGGACHNNVLPPVFVGNYATAVESVERIRVRGIEQQTMPPAGSGTELLTAEEACIILAWIEQGTPQGVPSGDPPPMPMDQGVPGPMDAAPPSDATVPESPTWDEHIGPLLLGNCSGAACHAGGGATPPALGSFAEFQTANAAGRYAADNDPATSVLVDRARARNGTTIMPPAYDTAGANGGPRTLNEVQLATIEAWITAGTPEN